MMDVIESGKMVVEKYYWGISDVESVEQQADFESDVVFTCALLLNFQKH